MAYVFGVLLSLGAATFIKNANELLREDDAKSTYRSLLSTFLRDYFGLRSKRCNSNAKAAMIEQSVDTQLAEQRLRNAKSVLSLIFWFTGITSCGMLSTMVVSSSSDPYSFGQHVAWICALFSSLFVRLHPGALNANNLPLWHCWFMALVTCYAVSGTDFVSFARGPALLWRVLIAQVCCQPGFVIVANTFFAAFSICSYNALLLSDPGFPNVIMYAGDEDAFIAFGIEQAYALCVIAAIVVGWESFQRAEIRSQESQRLSRTGPAEAVTSLLLATCDTVVQLDANLDIEDHETKFAQVLMRDVSSITGTPWTSCILNAEDRERFQFVMDDAVLDVAGLLHMDLCDSIKNPIAVEIQYVPFIGPDARRRVVLGITERSRFEEVPSLPELSRPTLTQLDAFSRLETKKEPIKRCSSRSGTPSFAASAPVQSLAASGCCKKFEWHDGKKFAVEQGKRMLKGFNKTSDTAKDVLVLEMLQRLNVFVAKNSCCKFHAALKDLDMTVKRLRKGACQQDWCVEADWQCGECGVMDLENADNHCDVCLGEEDEDDDCDEEEDEKQAKDGSIMI